MNAAKRRFGRASLGAGGLALMMVGACGGGGSSGGGGGPTPTSPSGGTIPTVAIRSGGTLDPQEIRIQVGQQVRFTNDDNTQHQPASNPHPEHTDCREIALPAINPGQSATTTAFNAAKSCGYHDHLSPDATRLHGIIRVGGDMGSPGPVYVSRD